MNQVITAVFEAGKLRPEIPLDLLNNQRYQIIVKSIEQSESALIESANLYAEIYEQDQQLQQLTESALNERE
ncbi:MAG: antitoxin AF2212-like protein [Merismopediaceae bacterium]|nr:antitoxin AF2212-like protein [Merismopediaceae bacterium]